MNILEKALNDFAQDLINHCAVVENSEITLPEEGLKNLISDYLKNDDPVIWGIPLEYIQEEADGEIERALTDIEINRLKVVFCDNDKVSWNRMVIIRDAIAVAVDNSKHEWDETDKKYQEEKQKEDYLRKISSP